jgi:hypothetical protein
MFSTYGPIDTPIADAGDSGFTRLNQRLRPDQLQPNEIAISENGRMGIDGAWQVRRGINLISDPLTTSGQVLTIPFYVYENLTPSALNNNSGVIEMTVVGHPFVDQTLAHVTGITGLTPAFTAGNYVVTVIDPNTVSIDLNGAVGTAGGTVTIGAPIIDDNVVNAIYASCVFSDPASANTEYIIIATNSKAVAIPVNGGAAIDIDYPAGVTLSAQADMIQAFDKVFIFRDGLTSLQWDGDLTGSPAFTLVANGAYAALTYLDASNNTVVADGIATVSETAHGLSVGDKITVIDKGSSSVVDGEVYTIATVANANTFTFFADVVDAASHKVVYSKRQSVSLGLMHMPCPPWAIYHQRRLWMPFKYLSSGSSGSPTITDRDIQDEIVASDIFDSDTYDRLVNQFRVASGGADYVVGIQPFADDNLLVFCRNSVHLVTGVSGDLTNAVVKEITREVGCVARKSIVQVGNQVFFLSDNGVYSVDFGDLYNLRGAMLPLSEAIQPIIDRLNANLAINAVAIYHDNRYYIAVPLDNSIENNAILVYNFINQGWESIDTVNDAGWNIRNLLRANAGGLNRLFAVNSVGGVHQIDVRLDDKDVIATQTGSSGSVIPIVSRMGTRAYTLGTIEKKRWNAYEIQAESSDTNTSDATIELVTENPDSQTTLKSLSQLFGQVLPIGEDGSFEGRCGNKRGYTGQLVITPTQGRPKIRTVKLSAQLVDLGTATKA